MRAAYRAAIEPILASGGTVILGVMMLVFSDLNSNRSLGPVAAVGILGALMAALTYLPAALLLLGRKAYWPVHPDYGTERPAAGFWAGVARLVSRHPRRIWIITALALGGFALYATQFDASGVPQSDAFTTETNGTQGQKVLAEHFPGGSGSPIVIIGPEADAQETLGVVRGTEGVASATPVTDPPGVPGAPVAVVDGVVQIEAVTEYEPDSEEAEQLVVDLREGLDAVSEDVLVGGNTAVNLDVKLTTQRDLKVIIPLVLLVTLLVLMALLRAVAAPVLLIATVVLSFAATVGVAAFVFFTLAGMAGSDPAIQLFGFVFLVSLGIDYNIFLMTRIREESINLGTRPGILKGLAVTGGVITSAGLVLAATFGALMVLPLLFLVQIAFLVSFGVLLDTFVVRSLLVPALAYDIGPKVWWPSKLAKAEQPDHGDHELDSELAGLVAKESAGATE
jgi:RND superfamily putative drug exporter